MSLSGAALDALVAEQLLHMLQPADVELSLAAEQARRGDRLVALRLIGLEDT